MTPASGRKPTPDSCDDLLSQSQLDNLLDQQQLAAVQAFRASPGGEAAAIAVLTAVSPLIRAQERQRIADAIAALARCRPVNGEPGAGGVEPADGGYVFAGPPPWRRPPHAEAVLALHALADHFARLGWDAAEQGLLTPLYSAVDVWAKAENLTRNTAMEVAGGWWPGPSAADVSGGGSV